MEQQLIELGQQYKEIIEKKDIKILESYKFICMIYGIIRLLDVCYDRDLEINLISMARTLLSEKIEKIIDEENNLSEEN